MGFRFARRLGWCVLLVVALGRASGAPWLRVATPELTLLTTLNKDEVIWRATEFQQFFAALRDYWGEPEGRRAPLTMIVFSRDGDFMRYRPLQKNGKPEKVGGFFAQREGWAVIGVPVGITEADQRAIFHESVHWFMSGATPPNPAWLEEGLAEVFSTFRIDHGRAVWGEPISDHVQLLRQRSVPPIGKILFADRGDLFRDTDRTDMFYAESWAFVHFLMFGLNGLPSHALPAYLQRLRQDGNPDDAFSQTFGRSYADIDGLLQRYIDDGRFHVPKRTLAATSKVEVEPASPMEVDEALGRLALVAERHDLALQHGRMMITRIPRDPRGHALAGLALQEGGDAAGALKEFAAAAEAGTADFEPYFEQAAAAQNSAATDGVDLTPAEARRIVDWYEKAIACEPHFSASYHNLAGVVGMLSAPTELDRSTLATGARLFPDDLMIRLGIAQLQERAGDAAGARTEVARVVERNANPTNDVGRFAQRIQTNWETDDFCAQVDGLMEKRQFEAALRLFDAAPSNPEIREQVRLLRPQVQALAATQRMNRAIDAQRWAEARRIIDDILASDAPFVTKTEVKRVLADLEHRHLLPERSEH